jgi:hypothetical protein
MTAAASRRGTALAGISTAGMAGGFTSAGGNTGYGKLSLQVLAAAIFTRKCIHLFLRCNPELRDTTAFLAFVFVNRHNYSFLLDSLIREAYSLRFGLSAAV